MERSIQLSALSRSMSVLQSTERPLE
uniref:Uncharacterized protein n=1 Tax=Anguilla anguilla TaxID=7936 RepID=A0A0E9T451_ANGAN